MVSPPDPPPGRRGEWWTVAILLAGLTVTAWVARSSSAATTRTSEREFEFACTEICARIQDRLRAHEQILRSAAAFVDLSAGVTRQQWRRFVELQEVDLRLPGIQGLGFSLFLPPQRLSSHVQEVRGEGFPDYQVRPPGVRDAYSSIVYLEPFTDRNLRAFGYDMLSEPVRRAAMERARDLHTVALSAKVKLVQETEKDVQAGTLMYMPVYRKGRPQETLSQRREALLGWVYSPYRMDDLMQGILGGWAGLSQKGIRLEVYDGETVVPDAVLYDSQSSRDAEPRDVSRLTWQTRIVSAGRPWTLRLTASAAWMAAIDYGKVWALWLGGASTSVLLSVVFFLVLNARSRALRMVEELAVELRRREQRYRYLLESMPDGFAYCRMIPGTPAEPEDFLYLEANPALEQVTGLGEVVGKTATQVHPTLRQSNPELFEAFGRVSATGEAEKIESYVVPLVRWLSLSVTRAEPGHFAIMANDITARKRAEQDLRESENNFRAFFEAVGDLLVIATPDGKILHSNRVLRQVLGYEDHELSSMHVLDLHPADKRAEAEAIFAAMLSGERTTCPLPIATRNGRPVPVETRIWFGRWNGGQCVFGVMKDLTVEQETQQLFERLFRHNPCPMALSTLSDRRFFDVNDAFVRMLGYPRSELIGKTSVGVDLFPHAEEVARAAEVIRLQGRAMDVELQVRAKEGAILDGLFSGEMVSNQGRDYFLTVMVDITHRKRAERALQESERRFATFFHASLLPAAISRTEDGVFVDANEAALRLFGYCREEVLGHTAGELGLWPDLQQREQLMDALRVHGSVEQYETRLRGRSGILRDVLVSAEFTELNGRQHLLALLMDITERRQAQAERQRLEAQAQQLQKAESLTRMAASVAHHFNNQIQAVTLSLDLADAPLVDLDGTDSAREWIANARQAARKAAQMSGMMLTYLGQSQSQREAADLAAIARRGVLSIRASLPPGVKIEAQLPDRGPVVRVAEDQIQQVVIQLLTNAGEALDKAGGTIRLRVDAVAASDIPTAYRFPIGGVPQAEDYGCLEVTDDGVGIPEPDLERVFDPFFTTKFTGRGMGLAVVLGIVRSHQGLIAVESRLGKGSRFRVFLPLLAREAPEPPRLPARSRHSLGGGTILLVEDEPGVRSSAVATLEHLGFEVVSASDGVEAVELFQSLAGAVRCVLCDLTMPRMDGWATLAALRQLTPDLPIILASGYSEAQVMTDTHSEMPQAFLSKPYELERLRDTLARVLLRENPPA